MYACKVSVITGVQGITSHTTRAKLQHKNNNTNIVVFPLVANTTVFQVEINLFFCWHPMLGNLRKKATLAEACFQQKKQC